MAGSDGDGVFVVDTGADSDDSWGVRLDGEGFDVTTGRTVADALENPALSVVDCVVCAHDPPDADALALLESVRTSPGELPVVVLVGDDYPDVAPAALEMGAAHVLPVGGDREVVTRTLSTTVRRASKEFRARTESETSRYRSLFENNPMVIWEEDFSEAKRYADSLAEEVADLESYLEAHPEELRQLMGRIEVIDVNQNAVEYYEADSKTHLMANLDQLMTDESATTNREMWAHIAAGETRFRTETVSQTLAGKRRHEILEMNVPEAHADDYSRVYITGTDITEKKRQKRELQRERKHYAALFENTNDAITRVRYDGETPVIQDANPVFEGLFAGDADVVGRGLDDVVAGHGHIDEARDISRRVRAGEHLTDEFTRETVDGPREFLWQAVPLEDLETGEVEHACAVYTDITERKRRERAIEKLHGVTQDLIEAQTPDEIATVAVESACDVLGLCGNGCWFYDTEVGELHPVAWTDEARDLVGEQPVIGPGDGPAWEAFESGEVRSIDDGSSVPATGPSSSIQSEIVLPLEEWGVMLLGSAESGAFDDVDVSLARTLAANTRAALVQAGRERELSERRRQLQRQNERLEEFTSIVSHDLRNPLSVATGRLAIAREERDSEHLDAVATAHDRMEALIDDLLTLAQQGDVVDELADVDLARAVEDAWETVATADATLRLETDTWLRADEARLRQLLENLLRNAIDHAGTDVTVTVGDLPAGFCVADDGPGIPPDEREEVFESGVSNADEGTGFGLAIVEEIVEAHGWVVTVGDSESGGARFEFRGVDLIRENGYEEHSTG
jgi:PAS domain S-box-containing protein